MTVRDRFAKSLRKLSTNASERSRKVCATPYPYPYPYPSNQAPSLEVMRLEAAKEEVV